MKFIVDIVWFVVLAREIIRFRRMTSEQVMEVLASLRLDLHGAYQDRNAAQITLDLEDEATPADPLWHLLEEKIKKSEEVVDEYHARKDRLLGILYHSGHSKEARKFKWDKES